MQSNEQGQVINNYDIRGMQKVVLNMQDAFTVFSTLLFMLYSLYLVFTTEQARNALNYCMLAVSVVVIVVFIIKIFVWNNKDSNIEESRQMKSAVRLTKYILKIAMFITVLRVLISIIISGKQNGFALLGSTISANLFFFALLVWDTLWIINSRKKRIIGRQVANARLKTDLSSYELSLRIRRRPDYISRVEAGEAYSGMRTWVAICDVLGIKLHDLFPPLNESTKSSGR